MPYLYSFTPEIVRYLQAIERARAEVSLTVLPPALADHIRLRARVRSTHFSTRIEGNRLTMIEAEQVLVEGRVLGLSTRQSRDLLNQWVSQGWLEISSAARKTRRYRLSAEYRRFISGITAH